MSDVRIIAATNKSNGGRGEYPVRYVVLKWMSGSAHPYSRHMQVFDGKHDDYFIYGHYKCTAEDAIEDMITSMIDNNKTYHDGNVSHIPGIDYSVDGYFDKGAWVNISYNQFLKKGLI